MGRLTALRVKAIKNPGRYGEATILVGFEDQDFTKNLVTVLCELRAVLTVPLPGAIIAGGLDGGDLILPSG